MTCLQANWRRFKPVLKVLHPQMLKTFARNLNQNSLERCLACERTDRRNALLRRLKQVENEKS